MEMFLAVVVALIGASFVLASAVEGVLAVLENAGWIRRTPYVG